MTRLHDRNLTDAELTSLAAVIAEVERTTAGEIRIVVQRRRRWNERHMTVRDIALQQFRRLGMENTLGRTGVLIFVLLSDHELQILADEGIDSKVDEHRWQSVADGMVDHFRKGEYVEGLAEAVRTVGGVLREYFPRRDDDRDELSNHVVQR